MFIWIVDCKWSWCSIFTVTTAWNTGETGDINWYKALGFTGLFNTKDHSSIRFRFKYFISSKHVVYINKITIIIYLTKLDDIWTMDTVVYCSAPQFFWLLKMIQITAGFCGILQSELITISFEDTPRHMNSAQGFMLWMPYKCGNQNTTVLKR